jgi:tryptophan halogenase
MKGAVQDLVIVGRDAPVWLAACVMQSALGPAGLRVTVVELPDALGAADVYATLPRSSRCTPGCASRKRA